MHFLLSVISTILIVKCILQKKKMLARALFFSSHRRNIFLQNCRLVFLPTFLLISLLPSLTDTGQKKSICKSNSGQLCPEKLDVATFQKLIHAIC